ncbi:MAG: response regulator [Chloroflexota bacterium]
MKERKRILLADDQDAVRELVAMTLGGDSFELLDAADGATALRMARNFRPDLVLLDVGMPELDGFTVCRALKDDPDTRDIPVVMLTAAGAEADRAAGRAAGADGYFTKPFSPTALVNKVYEVIGS